MNEMMPQQNIKKSHVWWVIVIVAALAAAAFWVFYLRPVPEQSSGANLQINDSAASISSDLSTTDVNNLDQGLTDIDKELAK